MNVEELQKVHDALSLLNSMVNCGDQHSSSSVNMTQAAFAILRKPLPPAEGAEEILDKYPHSIEYPSFVHENSAIAAMTEFATLHAQRIADKMVEKMSPTNEQIHAAALAWARDHSEAPDKDCPDWLIRDYEAGAYFVRQCYGCWNKTDKMVEERLRGKQDLKNNQP